MTSGTCKLTLKYGKFVKSHLIPQAFTRPEEPGLPLVQVGGGTPPKRRWSSWYDQKLVVEEGEHILRDLDTWAISFLRKAKLVWSGWGPALNLCGHEILGDQLGWGLRTIDVPDKDRLRLFLYSLLWRSAATSLNEFREIKLPAGDLETLRVALVEQVLPPVSFYPAFFTQLSSMGVIHNQTPFAGMKQIPSFEGEPEQTVPIFRFYFDGLIIHFHRHTSDDGNSAKLGKLVAGGEPTLLLSTIPYEASFQQKNLIYNTLGL